MANQPKPRCSFCNKNQNQVRKLIAGPGVYICDDCVALCAEIIDDELRKNVEDDINYDFRYQSDASKGDKSLP